MKEDSKKKADFIYTDPDLIPEHKINPKYSSFLSKLKPNSQHLFFIYGIVQTYTDIEKDINFYVR